MNAIRVLAASSLAIAGLSWGGPVHAQADYEAMVRLMGECAKIEEIGARAACYDKTVEAAQLIEGAQAGAATPKVSAPTTAERPASGFGSQSLRKPEPVSESRSDGEVEALVRTARRTEPGIYLLTLEDGAQWRFVDAVPPSYDPPRAGSEVELRSGSLGSFLMRYADQRSIRVQRVR